MERPEGTFYGRFTRSVPTDRREAPKVPDWNPLLTDEEIAALEAPPEEEENLCANCGAESPEEDEEYNEYLGLTVCESCHDRYTWRCPECRSEHSSEDEAYECCRHECPDCGQSWEYEEDARSCCGTSFHGDMPYLAPVDPYRVSVPEIAGRPVRLCSLEQELAKGGAMVARLLYDIGLADDASVQGYHYGGSRRGRAHVEEDGSLPSEGGEVVYDRFNLADNPEGLSLALTRIRQLRDQADRPVGTSYAAGIHVHISAKAEDGSCFEPRDVSALYELWCYAEDMLYSLSAAGWQRHRQPADDHSGYCKPVPKDNGATPRRVWQMMNRDRYFGLNFQRLFGAVERCSCGAARMGDWTSCDCGAFDRATVEWRVFNSSTLPRTIHAWLLFAHAMTAHATRHELGTLPPNDYGSSTREEKREVLEHLLGVLPLTDGERDVIREAADRSPGL
jgi:hypothetical protein